MAADNLAPSTNDDLLAIVRAANLAKRHAEACRQAAESGKPCQSKAPCEGATNLSNSLDDARTSLAAMQPRLEEARKDALRHFRSLEDQYVHNLKNDAEIQKALAYSKFLSDFSKLMFDAASIADGVNSINDIVNKLGNGENLSKADEVLLKIKFGDQSWELLSGSQSAIDDFTTFRGQQAHIPPGVADLLTVKGGASDLFGAFTDFREKYKALESGPASQRNLQGLRGSAKSLGQLAGKFLAKYSDKQQAALEDELTETAMNAGALDQPAFNAFRDYQRLVERELALEKALDAVREAYQMAYACAAKCPGSLGPAPVPDTSSMSYGEAIRKYNGRFGSLAQNVSDTAAKFNPEPCDHKTEGSKSTAGKSQKTTKGAKGSTNPSSQPKPANCGGGSSLAGVVEGVARQEAGCK